MECEYCERHGQVRRCETAADPGLPSFTSAEVGTLNGWNEPTFSIGFRSWTLVLQRSALPGLDSSPSQTELNGTQRQNKRLDVSADLSTFLFS